MSDDRPLLVVTPTLGRSPWLARTVDSVARFAGPRCQHVLVVPVGKLAEMGDAFPDCVVVADRARRGVYAGINGGIAGAPQSGWRWFTWINDDDELSPGFTAHLERALAEEALNGEGAWHYGQVRLVNASDEELGRLAVTRCPRDIARLAAQGINPLNQHGLLIPRAWVERLGPLSESFGICADVDYWLRAAVAGARFRFSPEVVGMFRLREGQASGDLSLHRAEFRRAVDAVRMVRESGRTRLAARARFRLMNLGVYLDRLRRAGWRGGYDLLEDPSMRSS